MAGIAPISAVHRLLHHPLADVRIERQSVRMLMRKAAMGTSVLLLTGCSHTYHLQAIVAKGHLAFIVDPRSTHKDTCFDSIRVTAADDNEAAAKPSTSVARRAASNDILWWKDYDAGSCQNNFPVLYGQHLAGPSTSYSAVNVEARPLRVGVVYLLETRGAGYGEGRFRIRADRTVENLPVADEAARMTGSKGS